MPTWLTPTVLLLVNVALAVVGLYWLGVLVRLVGVVRTRPFGFAGLEFARAHPSPARVCLVVPAHNEETALATLLPSLRAQDFPSLRVLVVLDRCTDASARVARALTQGDPRFEVLELTSCPEGWAGKVNAVWSGVEHAKRSGPSPDLLLFVDADTQLHPSCVTAAVGLLESRGLSLMSFLSTMTYGRWFEWLVQPAAGFELLRQYPVDRVNTPRAGKGRSFANGQFMLFRRDAYDALGGHAAVRDALLEDLALARAVRHAGGRQGLFFPGPLLTCRMYESWDQFTRGWRRIFIEGARRRVKRLAHGVHCGLWLYALGPWAAAAWAVGSAAAWARAEPGSGHAAWAAVGLAIGAATVLLHLIVVASAYRLARAPLWAVPLFGVGALLSARILWHAARDLRTRTPIQWGGRSYAIEPR